MIAPPLIYLGPTLPVTTARQITPADYRPPVKRGDLPQHYDGPVVIIDGEFTQNLSVSPKEILRLLDNGTPVWGAASMGALRAAELHKFGMCGLGWIFNAYRSGHVIADDEVAVSYSPDSMAPLTVPLINVRYWLERLRAAGELDGVLARRILARARHVFYAERTLQRLLAEWETTVGPREMARLFAVTHDQITDVKAADTLLVLDVIRRTYSQPEKRECAEKAGYNEH